jgi:asparagine N-glycosylation enzyme membrane subunit Stt3
MKDPTRENLRWALRTTLMFFVGVLPAIVMFVFILVMMPLAGVLPSLVSWLSLLAVLAMLGIAGLWTATFRDEHERMLPNAVTILLVLCGLLAGIPHLIGMTLEGIDAGEFSVWPMVALLGPVICGLYFLTEQLVIALRRRCAKSSSHP